MGYNISMKSIGNDTIAKEYQNINDNVDNLHNAGKNHVNGTDDRHPASQIDNDSSVTGATQKIVNETLLTAIENIVAAAVNAGIGVYKANDITNTNAYAVTISGLTVAGDISLNLSVTNINTGPATLDVNGTVNSIKLKKSDGTKEELTGGELYGINLLQHDGEDWILLEKIALETTPWLSQTATIFSLGIGYDDQGQYVDKYIQSIRYGLLSECLIKGNTISVLDGQNFDSGTGGYSAVNGTIANASGELQYTVSALSSAARIEKILSYISGDKIYVKYKINPKYANTTYAAIGGTQGTLKTPTANTNNIISDIITTVNNTDPLRIYHQTSSNYSVSDTFNFDDIMIINLTANGLDSLTQEQCDAMLHFMLTGVKSTLCNLFVSETQNRFDKDTAILGGYYDRTTNVWTTDASSFSSALIRIKPNTVYTKTPDYNRTFYDINGNFLTGTGAATGTTFTTPNNAYYMRFNGPITNIDTVMLVEGSTLPTTFVKYEIGEAFCPVELHSTPDGTKCEFDYKAGKHTKKHNKIVLTGNETVNIYTTKTNTIVFRIAMDGMKAIRSAEIISSNNFPSIDVIGVNDVEGITAFTNAEAYFGILKSKLDTENVSGFKTWLAANLTSVIYQYATPVIHEYPAQNIHSFENGTCMVLPRIKFNAYPDASTGEMIIPDVNIPIDSLISLKKITVIEGTTVYTDISFTDTDYNTTTISPLDSLTLDKDSQYEVVYDYPVALTTLPTVEMKLPINEASVRHELVKGQLSLQEKITDMDIFTLAAILNLDSTRNSYDIASHDYAAGTTEWTLSNIEESMEILSVTNAGGAVNIIAPDENRKYIVVNGSGHTVTIKKSGGTGVTIANGNKTLVFYDGSDYAILS